MRAVWAIGKRSAEVDEGLSECGGEGCRRGDGGITGLIDGPEESKAYPFFFTANEYDRLIGM